MHKLITKGNLALMAASVVVAASAFVPMANAAELTAMQQSAIIQLLSSFGASASTIAEVQTALSGGASAGENMPVTSTVTPPAMVTNPSSSSCTMLTPVGPGASGAAVMCLQDWLMERGYSIPAGATGTYGPETEKAVTDFQTSVGVTPTGYFGPLSISASGSASANDSSSMTMPAASAGSVSTATLNAQMNAISNEQTGLSSDLSEGAAVSAQSDVAPAQ
jgi:peptidoglycan hydrolase-like protein with peptidoglycan-binding domain